LLVDSGTAWPHHPPTTPGGLTIRLIFSRGRQGIESNYSISAASGLLSAVSESHHVSLGVQKSKDPLARNTSSSDLKSEIRSRKAGALEVVREQMAAGNATTSNGSASGSNGRNGNGAGNGVGGGGGGGGATFVFQVNHKSPRRELPTNDVH
jgi:hypothetical protein